MKPTDHMAFRNEFIILEDDMPFGDKMETWQKEDFASRFNVSCTAIAIISRSKNAKCPGR